MGSTSAHTDAPGDSGPSVGSRARRTKWVASVAVVTSLVVGTAIVAGAHGDHSTARTAGHRAPADRLWCNSDHEPLVPSLHHAMPTGMRMNMVMPPLTAAQCRTLHRQVVAAAHAAMRFPTLADAKRAGYLQVGYFFPGMGLHMVQPQGDSKAFDPAAPTYLLYDGTAPTSRISGLAYEIVDPSGAIPTFFVGNHDMPHSHAWCPKRPGWSDDRVPGQPGCTNANAYDANTWMIHAWVVPDRPSPWGLFSSLNPAITWHGWNAQHPMTVPRLNCAYLGQGPNCGLH